jgi:hypothetical protein
MAKIPSQLTYNDLNGQEAFEILVDWFRNLLAAHPQFQPHLTLPMARITLDVAVQVDMFIGGSVPVAAPPETLQIASTVALSNNVKKFRTVVNAAPVPGGVSPDQIRAQHNLPVSRPGFGDRDTGSHLFLADVPQKFPDSPPLPPVSELSELHSDQQNQQSERKSEFVRAESERHSEQLSEHLEMVLEETERPAPPPSSNTGTLPAQYVFAGPPHPAVGSVENGRQSLDTMGLHVDIALDGRPIRHESGMITADHRHVASQEKAGDRKGRTYGSVAGVYDPGPIGLIDGHSGGAVYGDGRPRIMKF